MDLCKNINRTLYDIEDNNEVKSGNCRSIFQKYQNLRNMQIDLFQETIKNTPRNPLLLMLPTVR